MQKTQRAKLETDDSSSRHSSRMDEAEAYYAEGILCVSVLFSNLLVTFGWKR